MVVKNQKKVEDDMAHITRLKKAVLPNFVFGDKVPTNLKDYAKSKLASKEGLNYILSLNREDPETDFAKCYALENPKIGTKRLIEFLLEDGKTDTAENRGYIISIMRNTIEHGMENVFDVIKEKFIRNKDIKRAYVKFYELYKTRVLLRD